MVAKSKKALGKIDLLKLSDVERTKVIEQLKQSLHKSVSEAKLWKTLLQYEVVVINGQVVFSNDSPLEGLSIQFNIGGI